MAGCVPADVPAFENGDAGAQPRGLQRRREAGKPRPDHADIDIQIERKPRALSHRRGVRSVGRACGSLAHIVSYGPIWPLSPCTIGPNPKFAQPCRALFSETSDSKGHRKSTIPARLWFRSSLDGSAREGEENF